MKLVFLTTSVSAHQLPLARELVARLGADGYRYLYTGDALQGGGQEVAAAEPWIVRADPGEHDCRAGLENCDVLVSSIRDLELFENRCRKGLTTFYMGERWFKPLVLKLGPFALQLPGCLRLAVGSYRRMARRFAAWTRNDPHARCLAIGPWARKDLLRLGVEEAKIEDWGYFVARSRREDARRIRPEAKGAPTKVLWVGRMLDWKRVDALVRAVAAANAAAGTPDAPRRFTLTLVGDGPERERLSRLAAKLDAGPGGDWCEFRPPVAIDEVRSIMRRHDVYVLASNAREGWGAALNEALEEGLVAFGTFEAGASAAMLPADRLFHAGDWRALARLLLRHDLAPTSLPAAYDPVQAALRLLGFLGC